MKLSNETAPFFKLLSLYSGEYTLLREYIVGAESPAIREVDLLASEPDRLVKFLKNKIGELYNLDLKVVEKRGSTRVRGSSKAHTHLDLFAGSTFKFRFDIYSVQALEVHNHLKRGSLDDVFSDLKEITIFGGKNFIPNSNVLHLILLSEYYTCFVDYPSKFKHWEYISNRFNNCDSFLYTHQYIDIESLAASNAKVWRRRFIKGFVPDFIYFGIDLIRHLRKIGFRPFVLKVISKIFRT